MTNWPKANWAGQALALLKPMLEDPAVLKIGQNMKYDAKILRPLRHRGRTDDDTMLMSYALHAGEHMATAWTRCQSVTWATPHPDQITARGRQIRDHL
jgi:DNA polymerase I-like protein with 3'-5' exonuclease and polymerase domains